MLECLGEATVGGSLASPCAHLLGGAVREREGLSGFCRAFDPKSGGNAEFSFDPNRKAKRRALFAVRQK